MGKILEFKMDKIVRGKLLDSSDSKLKATVGGAVIVEDPNPIFNRVISFDGVDDYVKLPAHPSGIKAFSMWINWRYTGGYRYLFDTRPANDLLWFGVGGTSSNWKKMSVDGKKRKLSWSNVPQNKWVHIYFEVTTPFTSSLFLMSQEGKAEFAAGKISRLRMYDRALTGKQLEAIRSEDLAVRNTYRAPLPIDFNLLNKEEETKTLYIRDIAKLNSLEMEILNTSPKNIVLKKNIDKDDFHFALAFRPGVLDVKHLNLIKEKSLGALGKGWEISSTIDAESNNLVVIKMRKASVNPSTDKIIAGNSWSLPLDGLFADNHYGSRSTQVMLKYQNLLYAGDAETSLTGTQIAYLNIVSRTGKEYIPLHVGFIGSNKVVNNGEINRSLILRMTNTSEDYTIKSQDDGSGGDKDSQFTFDFIGRNDTEESKLTDGKSSYNSMNLFAEMKEMDGRIKEAKTALIKTVTDAEANWVYKLGQPLGPGEYIDVEITGIQTTNPSGLANLYVKYEDIPGYWDGKFVVAIEKGPMVFQGNNVGIGTNQPEAPLSIGTAAGKEASPDSKMHFTNDCILFGGVNEGMESNSAQISAGKHAFENLCIVGMGSVHSNRKITMWHEGGLKLVGPVTVTEQLKGSSLDVESGSIKGGAGTFSGAIKTDKRIQDKTGDVMPVGSIIAYAGATPPEGWLLCDGHGEWNTARPDLYAAIGYTYGKGTQSNRPYFKVPDLRNRFIAGTGNLTSRGGNYTRGSAGGAHQVTLSRAQMPKHSHGVNDPGHRHRLVVNLRDSSTDIDDSSLSIYARNSPTARYTDKVKTGISIKNSEGGGAHENRPPFLALNYIIKY